MKIHYIERIYVNEFTACNFRHLHAEIEFNGEGGVIKTIFNNIVY